MKTKEKNKKTKKQEREITKEEKMKQRMPAKKGVIPNKRKCDIRPGTTWANSGQHQYHSRCFD